MVHREIDYSMIADKYESRYPGTILSLWSIFVMCSAGSRKRQRTNW